VPKKSKAQFKTAYVPVCGTRGKKTSIGRNNVGFSRMNKNKKRSWKKYRGQGK
tara:strand:+ start:871 stop:1029 length:159 start_codon:yes stop_codon:yes gene_type:complete